MASGSISHDKAGDMRTSGSAGTAPPQYSEEELRQTDRMINHMLLSYVALLLFGWGLLFFDWAFNELEKHPKAEPWINDAVTIGGASAVLSPIIQPMRLRA
ncbi:hypothetical protein COCOBI_09-1840 [Coccomyxa sp. Obi]|nr:hypothetical protein COCOBI_09-1840 [Coccomyxa sp. Obi]